MKNRLLTLLTLLTLALALPSLSDARLLDTPAELRDRYGEPVETEARDGVTVYRFDENALGLTVTAEVSGDKCVAITYESAKDFAVGTLTRLVRLSFPEFPERWEKFGDSKLSAHYMSKGGDLVAYDRPIADLRPATLLLRTP